MKEFDKILHKTLSTSKYRGKRIDNGEWVYGDIWTMGPKGYGIVNDGNQDCESKDFNKIAVIPKTVTEFIGFSDKNGVEIYEDDIFLSSYANEKFESKGIVKFINGLFFAFIVPTKGYPYLIISLYNFLTHHPEVIGNIHDNPELLDNKNIKIDY